MKALLNRSPFPAPVFVGVFVSWLPISVAVVVGVLTTLVAFSILHAVFRNDEDRLSRY